jgi:hypothetical protein
MYLKVAALTTLIKFKSTKMTEIFFLLFFQNLWVDLCFPKHIPEIALANL